MKSLLAVLVLSSSLALAGGPDKGQPRDSRGESGGTGSPGREDREEMRQRMHMMAVVGIAEALQLNEAEALKLVERLKAFEEKRRGVREAMHESMKSLKAAAEGDATAAAQVDQNVQKVLDGRAQMAALDKEMFTALAAGQTPQKKAKLALFMARMQQLQHKGMGGGRGGRFHED